MNDIGVIMGEAGHDETYMFSLLFRWVCHVCFLWPLWPWQVDSATSSDAGEKEDEGSKKPSKRCDVAILTVTAHETAEQYFVELVLFLVLGMMFRDDASLEVPPSGFSALRITGVIRCVESLECGVQAEESDAKGGGEGITEARGRECRWPVGRQSKECGRL